MFDTLTDKFSSIFKNLRGYGVLTEKNLEEALREVRLSLLEADVHIGVVKAFLEKTKERSLGTEVLGSLNPGEQFLKIVHEELVLALGEKPKTLEFSGSPPHVVLMVGLQGTGKTTTTGKLAAYYKKKGRHPYLIPADVNRPAAIEQLKVLSKTIEVPCYDTQASRSAVENVSAALKASSDHFCDLILVDSAGRLHLDETLMGELEEMKKLLKRFTNSFKILLVVDALSGQTAVQAAKAFHEKLHLDGLILTKLDGDAKGGAALSIQSVAGCPVYFAGVGEKIEDLEVFDPERLVSRLLDRGDILSLVEKAKDVINEAEAKEVGKRFLKNQFSLEDFLGQMRQMKKMGSVSNLLGMLPGGKGLSSKVDMGQVEKDLKKKEAIISSMTKLERERPEVLNGTRRLRIAKGSGTQVSDVNRLLKEFGDLRKMMKSFSGKGMKNLYGLKSRLGL